jgi:hypothetical protein
MSIEACREAAVLCIPLPSASTTHAFGKDAETKIWSPMKFHAAARPRKNGVYRRMQLQAPKNLSSWCYI